MNSNLKRVALALGSALFSTTVLAGGGNTPAPDATASTKTRAQVRAELKVLPALIQGDRYPVIEPSVTQRSRAEVRAEVRDDVAKLKSSEYAGS